MAGRNSGKINAKVLILNHISSKSDRSDNDGESVQLRLIREAKAGSNNRSEVLVGYDFMELLVPWLGFGANITKSEEAAATNAQDEDPSLISEPKEQKRADVVKGWFDKGKGKDDQI